METHILCSELRLNDMNRRENDLFLGTRADVLTFKMKKGFKIVGKTWLQKGDEQFPSARLQPTR